MKIVLKFFIEVSLIPFLIVLAIWSRFKSKKIKIGLGPDPLINNFYHKKALELCNYSSETFVKNSFHITDEFDIDVSRKFNLNNPISRGAAYLYLIFISFRYKVLYINFNGGVIGLRSIFLWKIEPLILKLAKIKTVILPYGSDVQDMSRSDNLIFKDTIANDYPDQKIFRKTVTRKIDLWTKYADHIIGGCEWVDYMYHWDTLMLAHFSIDLNKITKKQKIANKSSSKKLNILHAPNHKNIKGTFFLTQAIENLKRKGYDIDLLIAEKKSNNEILDLIKKSDIIADQFIIGWYAMFAIEAMANAKPVLCYLRQDLIDLYKYKGLIKDNEIPIINANIFNLEEKILWCYENKNKLHRIGEKGYEFVKKHHSINSVASIFDKINKEISL
tara:strand:+ start:797 stop:1960 length:1164 start_codon:yes stop_codon:yes gene_type:complete